MSDSSASARPTPPDDKVRSLLKSYPAGTAEAAAAFLATRDPGALATALSGVLRFHQPPPVGQAPRLDPASAPGNTHLVADLGIDSLAMVEMSFLLTDLWGVTFADDELRAITTLDDLRSAILRKLPAA